MERNEIIHSHKCGWSPVEDSHLHGKGCGHVFTHPTPAEDISDDLYARVHACPICGRGPWIAVWVPEVEAEWNSLSLSEQLEVRALVQQQVRLERMLMEHNLTILVLLETGEDDDK